MAGGVVRVDRPVHRWVTVQFVAATTPRSAYYVALDLSWSRASEAATASYEVYSRPIVGTLVRHLIDDETGHVVDSLVMWAIESEESSEIVPVDDHTNPVVNVRYLGSFPDGTHPEQQDVDDTVDGLRQRAAAELHSYQQRRQGEAA